MNKCVVLALGAALSMSANLAFAWSDVSGKVTKLDTNAHRIVLDNGKTYSLQNDVSMRNIKAGDKVTLSVEEQNGKNMVNKVTKPS